jgi:hypothetical protein
MTPLTIFISHDNDGREIIKGLRDIGWQEKEDCILFEITNKYYSDNFSRILKIDKEYLFSDYFLELSKNTKQAIKAMITEIEIETSDWISANEKHYNVVVEEESKNEFIKFIANFIKRWVIEPKENYLRDRYKDYC